MNIPSSPPAPRRWPRRLAIAAAGVVVLAIAIPFSYIHFVEKKAPPKLSLQSTASSSSSGSGAAGSSGSAAAPAAPASAADTGGVSGAWSVGKGSLVGYRVKETLIGQKTTAVGRTSAVSGSLSISGTSVDTATFTAQMASVKSDQSQRDNSFDTRIMDVAKYPTAVFALSSPIALGAVPAVGAIHSYSAAGNLTLRGQTHPVTFTLSAERTATGIAVQGEIPVPFVTWGVPNPSFGSFVTTADNGTMEFLLQFGRGAQSAGPTTTVTPPAAGGGGAGGFQPITPSPTTTPPLTIAG